MYYFGIFILAFRVFSLDIWPDKEHAEKKISSHDIER